MSSSSGSKLRALLKKNFIIMKRNFCTFIAEVFFPIILMVLIYGIRKAFKIKYHYFEDEEKNDANFLSTRAVKFSDSSNTIISSSLNTSPFLQICYENDKGEKRPLIGIINVPTKIQNRIKTLASITDPSFIFSYKSFESVEKMRDYVKDGNYGTGENELLCFAISYSKEDKNYKYGLHYFDSSMEDGIQDIPDGRGKANDQFQEGPDMDSYDLYLNNGLNFIQKIFGEYIIDDINAQSSFVANIEIGMVAQKYNFYRTDPFGAFVGYIVPFFIVIAYMCPLCLYVLRMVREKETKAKEGMKIMGMSEGIYFLSYFIQYFIVNLIYSIANTIVISQVFKHVNVIFIFLLFFLWGMCVFSLAFFFQSFIDKTRVALILSLLLYFIMFFLSMAVMSENANKILKIILSIFPPVTIELGVIIYGYFESHFKDLDFKHLTKTYQNYSVLTMIIMLIIDFFLFLFLGYYLQNVVSHDFGISKPFYFLCTKSYWCGSPNKKKKKNVINQELMDYQNEINGNNQFPGNPPRHILGTPTNYNTNLNYNNNNTSNNYNSSIYNKTNQNNIPKNNYINDKNNKDNLQLRENQINQKQNQNQYKPNLNTHSYYNNINNNNLNNNNNVTQNKPASQDNFESEELYRNMTDKTDLLQIINLVKKFSDGKVAVKGVSLNLYKNEIFALLGHNGAGKTTMISMLCGMYDSSGGEAFYDGMDILDGDNMDIFRNKLGICPQHDVLFDDLTVREHLSMFGTFKGVSFSDLNNEVNKTMKDFHMSDIHDVTAKELSAGQRRKLSIAIALIGGSEVIFLDEPSSGMDITSRRNLWEILKRMTENKIIILTTHYMEEASVLGNRIGIINSGEMKCVGTPLFLIEKFGKFMSLRIVKDNKAMNDDIVEFISSQADDIEYEILSEEILFRIPKENYSGSKPKMNLKTFFHTLDQKQNILHIKTYSASMPTLEDVFLNIAAEDLLAIKGGHRKFSQINVENDKILFELDMRNISGGKFCNDFIACFKKRFKQTIRDMKGFFLEILCPILLIVIGLLVSKIKFKIESDETIVAIDDIGKQKIYYSGFSTISVPDNFIINLGNISSSKEIVLTKTTSSEALTEFYYSLYTKKDTTNFGSMLLLKYDKTNYQFSFIEYINTQARQGALYFTYYFITQIIKDIDSNVKITCSSYPMPLTKELQNSADQSSNSLIVFFVAVAFSLIPANFITIIVKERVNNSKHLMKISGMSFSAYWIVNYIFELIKYYFTAGICMLLLNFFDFMPKFFIIFYIIYGPSMTSFTYLLSFSFDEETSAQNGAILLNFLIGALGSSVVLMFRGLDNMKDFGKFMEFLFNFVPSFSFAFAFDVLLNKYLLLIVDYPDTWYSEYQKNKKLMISSKYTGFEIFFLIFTFILYTILIIRKEYKSTRFSPSPNNRLISNSKDENVLKEIARANNENYIPLRNQNIDMNNNNNISENINTENHNNVNSKNDIEILPANNSLPNSDINNMTNLHNPKAQYAIHIQNLEKHYTRRGCCGTCCCLFCNMCNCCRCCVCSCCEEVIPAVRNVSFVLEYGECFGLLGVNGAGKTTTFKCITNEHSRNNGNIFVDGKSINENFSKVSQMFGYCPQFDAIFEYMSVYENLEFYARIKGIKGDNLKKIIMAMIEEMSLGEFTNKISGRLSGGNKRKLSVAISMICNPPIILLDEPSTGMDPEARRFMWAVIHKISTKRKKSSVIMTTHAMDEAETLCKRMGIMVNGEFACLGSSTEIKEKYGYGFEIDIRIKPMKESEINRYLGSKHIEKDFIVTDGNIRETLSKCNKGQFIRELEKGRLGEKLIRQINLNGKIKIEQLLSWIYYCENALKLIKIAKEYFPEVILTEFIGNNFLFKLKKGYNSKSIGFLFGLFESVKDEYNITEYSIQQTSLEQIFNMFAVEQGKNKDNPIVNLEDEEKKTEIIIDDELIKSLIGN